MDKTERQILQHLQENAAHPVAGMACKVGLSATPCWWQIQRIEELGVIRQCVALLDAEKLGFGMSVFVAVRTDQQNADWQSQFTTMVLEIPEVGEFCRMSGEVDYMLHAVFTEKMDCDAFYRKRIFNVELTDVSSSFAMDQIKCTTALALATESANGDGNAR